MGQSKAGRKDITEASRVIYDAGTGRIVHLFHIGAASGGKLPGAKEIDQLALKEAARMTGLDMQTLATRPFDRRDLKPGKQYVVRLKDARLIERDERRSSTFVGA